MKYRIIYGDDTKLAESEYHNFVSFRACPPHVANVHKVKLVEYVPVNCVLS